MCAPFRFSLKKCRTVSTLREGGVWLPLLPVGEGGWWDEGFNDSSVQMSESSVQMSESSVQMSESSVHLSESSVQMSESSVHLSESSVQMSESSVHLSESSVDISYCGLGVSPEHAHGRDARATLDGQDVQATRSKWAGCPSHALHGRDARATNGSELFLLLFSPSLPLGRWVETETEPAEPSEDNCHACKQHQSPARV